MRQAVILAPTVLGSSKLWNNYLICQMPSLFYFPLAFRWQPLKQYLDVEKHVGAYLPLNSSSFSWLPKVIAYGTWVENLNYHCPVLIICLGKALSFCLQDNSNSQQVKARVICTTRKPRLWFSWRYELLSR